VCGRLCQTSHQLVFGADTDTRRPALISACLTLSMLSSTTISGTEKDRELIQDLIDCRDYNGLDSTVSPGYLTSYDVQGLYQAKVGAR